MRIVHFTTSRELECFFEKELNSQTGCTKDEWDLTLTFSIPSLIALQDPDFIHTRTKTSQKG